MSAPQWGHVAEWLRSGLQNCVLRFYFVHCLKYLDGVHPLRGSLRGSLRTDVVTDCIFDRWATWPNG